MTETERVFMAYQEARCAVMGLFELDALRRDPAVDVSWAAFAQLEFERRGL